MTTKISILKVLEDTSVDGPGFRVSIYCAGCDNHCKGCQNPQSYDINNGTMTDIEDLLNIVKANSLCNVTFSGGDPMCQPLAFAELARLIKSETNKTIWCYSGYTVEQILNDKDKLSLLSTIDVLVDGRFVQEKRDESLIFRGSSNQRLIDAKASIEQGKAVLFNYNPFPVFDDLKPIIVHHKVVA